jgi:hypothetical protein
VSKITRVSEPTSLAESWSASQSPLWSDLFARLEAEVLHASPDPNAGPSSLDAAGAEVARAHSSFLVALESGSKIGDEAVSRLDAQAVALVLAVARLWGTFRPGVEDRRVALIEQLRRRLAAQEDAVLAGEVTYSLWSEHAEQPSAAMRQALARLSRDSTAFQGDLLSLTVAAADLASLLVRLAANAAASGRGGEAPEERSTKLDQKLRAVTAELAARAQEVERPVSQRGDVVAHHLAAGLRVRFSQGMPRGLSASSPDRVPDPTDLEGLRDAWLELATNEYVAVAALDIQLETPAYKESFGSLSAAIVESAANVICGARLRGRPGAFRHRRAWRHQTVALTYALEAYVAGLRGHAPSLAQAQLIALTRLVRATVAITLIDFARAEALPGNGSQPRSEQSSRQ